MAMSANLFTYAAACKCIFTSKFTSPAASSQIPLHRIYHSPRRCTASKPAPVSANSFTWDDVLWFTHSEEEEEQKDHGSTSDLTGYFDKVAQCNRNIEKLSEFIPFVMEEKIVGYVHRGFADTLRGFPDVFLFLCDVSSDGRFAAQITLQPTLDTYQSRTSAINNVITCLGEDVIPGIRNELYPVMASFGSQEFFSIERAAAPCFGIKAYGVHMNGFVEKDGKQFLWVGKRSQMKQTFPGMLDHLVAGGLPHGIASGKNLIKECEEEAGIPQSISTRAKSVGAISYMDIDGHRFKRDVLFCYDLKLPEDFIPHNQDGEVESFRLISVVDVAEVIRATRFFKPNCSLVIIDFLFRHGYIRPEDAGYLNLLQSLRKGDCS